jgi:hypothetical protein
MAPQKFGLVHIHVQDYMCKKVDMEIEPQDESNLRSWKPEGNNVPPYNPLFPRDP